MCCYRWDAAVGVSVGLLLVPFSMLLLLSILFWLSLQRQVQRDQHEMNKSGAHARVKTEIYNMNLSLIARRKYADTEGV